MRLPIAPELQIGGAKNRLLAPLNARYRGKATLARETAALQAVMPFVVVTADQRLAYVKNSKCGCTSIAHAMYTYDTGARFDGNIHRDGPHLQQGWAHWQRNLQVMKGQDRVLFTTVREPIARFVSAYFDFVVQRKNPEARHYETAFGAAGLYDAPTEDGLDGFIDLVAEVFENDPILADRHWRPQVLNIAIDRFDYDVIGRLESLAQDMDTVRDLLGVNATQLPMRVDNRTSSAQYAPTAAQRQKITALYADDFEALGY
jgi:hypothetical protein